MELRSVTGPGKHHEIISLIVSNPKWTADEKAHILEANALIFRSQPATAALYHKAADGQRIYHLLHDCGPPSRQLVLSLAKYLPEELESAIVFDKNLSVSQKVAWLGDLRKCSPELSAGLLKAYREQSAQLAKTARQKQVSQTQKQAAAAKLQEPALPDSQPVSQIQSVPNTGSPVPLESLGFSPSSLAAHSGVLYYAKHTLKMEPETVLSILQEHWEDICHDFAKIESDRNGLRGPGRAVPPNYVAYMLARLYLNGEARRMPPAMMEAIIGRESNWNKDAVSNYDMGPFQLNKSAIDDMCQVDYKTNSRIRMNEVNAQMKKWGLKSFDMHLGMYYETSREKGRGWKKLEFSTDPKSRYYRALCSPDALEMAAWLIVRKMLDNDILCPPDKMSEEQMQRLFRAYNSSSGAGPYASEVIELFKKAQSP